MKRIVELKEEEDEQEREEEEDDQFDDSHDEVFSLELERSEKGLGLALVDTRVSERQSSITSGIWQPFTLQLGNSGTLYNSSRTRP